MKYARDKKIIGFTSVAWRKCTFSIASVVFLMFFGNRIFHLRDVFVLRAGKIEQIEFSVLFEYNVCGTPRRGTWMSPAN